MPAGVEDERAPLVGSEWERWEKQGDGWDGPIVVRGVFDLGADHGGLELVIQPKVFGEPCLTADVESFATAYRRLGDDEPVDNVRERVRAIAERLG